MLQPYRRSLNRSAVAAGFTLIELMIAIAIVAILATMAIASYDFAMVKARRGAAEGCLQEQAQFLERFYTTHLAYDADTDGNAVPAPACSQDVDNFYTVGFATGEPTSTTYRLEAVPTASQNDGRCGTLSIDHRGIKGATGTAGAEGCW